MKLIDLSKLKKFILPLALALILATIGIISTPGVSEGSGLRKIDFREVYIPLLEDEGLELVEAREQEELELILIKAEVLSLASAAKGSQSLSEAFLYVKNQGQIGEDFVVCFMPESLSAVFSTALTNKYAIQVWGVEMAPPTMYESMTTKGYIVFAARVLRDDIPASFTNLGIFYEAFLPEPQREIMELKP